MQEMLVHCFKDDHRFIKEYSYAQSRTYHTIVESRVQLTATPFKYDTHYRSEIPRPKGI